MATINTAGRRLITGENTAGRSEFVSDAPTDVTLHVPGHIEMLELWRISRIPARFTDDDSPVGDPILSPPPGGLVARLVGIPPTGQTSGVDADEAAAVFEQMGGTEARTGGPAQHAGMHRTPTVDLIYVVSGELYLVLDEGEKLLIAGDLLVQRGTNHAWTNRSNETAYLFAVLIAAEDSVTNNTGNGPE